MILALYTNDSTGAAYPSATTVAREAGVDERAVFRALKSLVKSGELEIVAKRNHQPTLYRVAVPTDESVTRDQQPTDESVTSHDEPTDVFDQPTDVFGEPIDESVIQPLERHLEVTSTSSLVSILDDDEIADGEIVDEEDRLQRIIQGVVGVGMRGCNRAAPNSAGWNKYRSGIVQTVREREDEIAALVADCTDAPDSVLTELAAHLIWPDPTRSLTITLQRLKYSRSSLGLALPAMR